MTSTLRQSLIDRGLTNTVRRAWRKANSALRERRLGICTTGSITGEELSFGEECFGYQAVPYASFDAAMQHMTVRPGEDVFVDYGCGMGRAVVLAATYPFKRVIGIERSESLCQIARHNLDHAKPKLCCKDVSIAAEDARSYELPHDATHIFLFNPFDEPIVEMVLNRIRESLELHPRKLSIIYALPKCRRDLMREASWLFLQHDLKTIDSDWQRLAIYESLNEVSLVPCKSN